MNKKTKTTQTNTFGYMTPPRTAEDDKIDAELATEEKADPSIQYDYANRKKQISNRLDDKFGANYSPETADAMKYTAENELDQQHGQTLAEDAFRRKNARFGKLIALKQLRDPRMVQTGGNSTQTTNGADFWNSLGLGVVSAAI